jgi:3-hydroxyacyl-[acyl-carrier-protein] dehydratase
MRFRQIDKITELIPGKSITAEKTLSGNEDYLRDHFPRFAVQPGVMMLESIYQASQFLVRASENYQTGLVMLRETRNVKFASFLQPGDTLIVECEILKSDGKSFTLKCSGRKSSGELCLVVAKLVVDCVQTNAPRSVDLHAAAYIRQIVDQLQQVAMA